MADSDSTRYCDECHAVLNDDGSCDDHGVVDQRPLPADPTDAERRFATFGPEVGSSSVPALVRAGVMVWSFGYGDDDDFTTIDESDLWAFEGETADADVVASWAPFRVDATATPVDILDRFVRTTCPATNKDGHRCIKFPGHPGRCRFSRTYTVASGWTS